MYRLHCEVSGVGLGCKGVSSLVLAKLNSIATKKSPKGSPSSAPHARAIQSETSLHVMPDDRVQQHRAPDGLLDPHSSLFDPNILDEWLAALHGPYARLEQFNVNF